MKPNTILILLRWFQWLFSLLIFGTVFVFFLYDVNYYIYTPTTLNAQVGLAGFLHMYLYISSIWTSCMGGLNLFWATTDVIFAAVTLAVAGLSQPQTSTYCVGSLAWPWSSDYLAYVPPTLGAANPGNTKVFDSSFLHIQCDLFATLAAVAGVLL